jgi:diguanylate cyclase (GGDEF)-like protein
VFVNDGLAHALHSLWNSLIPVRVRRDPHVLRQAGRIAAFDLAMLCWVSLFAVIYAALGAPLCAEIAMSGGLVLLCSLWALQRGLPLWFSANLLCGAGWYTVTCLSIFTGGVEAPAAEWYVTLPIGASLIVGIRGGLWWTATCAATVAGFALARQWGYAFPSEITLQGLRFLQCAGLVGLMFCIYLLTYVLSRVELDAQHALEDANRKLARLATTDALTGIANRRSFDRALRREWLRHQRAGQPLSLALIDTDHFKQYNDVRGHLDGDACLRSIARVIETCVRRPGDLAARFGGEEFAVILSETDPSGALQVGEDIRNRVRKLAIDHPNSSVDCVLTVSVGLATIVPHAEDSMLELVRLADRALYQAKANGRDQTIHSDVPVPASRS